MRPTYSRVFLLLVVISFGAIAELDKETIYKAEKIFFDEYYKTEYSNIAEQLRIRGLSEAEIPSVATRVTATIASCIVGRLVHDPSQVAKSYLVMITDGTPLHDKRGFLDDAYSDDEMDAFQKLTLSAMTDCRAKAYEASYLTPE